jgi:hypothetical protein
VVAVMKAIMRIEPGAGRTNGIPSLAIYRAPMNYGVERQLRRRRTSALRRIDGLQRVDNGLSLIRKQALAGTSANGKRHRQESGHEQSFERGTKTR